jgi:hypothetical protein
MSLSGPTTTRLKLPSFADTDSPDLGADGLYLILQALDVAVEPVSVSTFAGGPPASPVDGQIWVATNVTNGRRWRFQWDAAGAKWRFLGGAALVMQGGSAGTSSTSYASLSSAVSYTVVRSGVYDLEWSADFSHTIASALSYLALFYNGSLVWEAGPAQNVSAGQGGDIGMFVPDLAMTAGNVVDLRAKTNTGTLSLSNATLRLIPTWIT